MSSNINQNWKMICRYMNEFDLQYHKLAEYFGLSDSSFWILYELYESKNGCTQKELCYDYAINKQTINSAVKCLIKEGYVILENLEDSKKYKVLKLTEDGKNIAKNTIGKVMRLENKTSKDIDENEMLQVVSFLEKQAIIFTNEVNAVINDKNRRDKNENSIIRKIHV